MGFRDPRKTALKEQYRQQNFMFNNPELYPKTRPDIPTITDSYLSTNGHVVFAGCYKGAGLATLIDRKMLTQEIKHIIFVDDNPFHLDSVYDAFKERSETAHCIQYNTPK